jgi:histidinol phosphatase-like PHP family hydrolase
MYNLHCHSLLSDGVLLPSEIAVRYLSLGYKAIAITDHVDYSNIKSTVKSILEFTRHWPKHKVPINVLPGIELTHLPLSQFAPLAKYARRQGIKVIVAHGQTPAEPVINGTNLAALNADIDILAHPGLIRDEEIKLAKRKGIFLEVTARRGHCLTNPQVVKRALRLGAKLILNTDSHAPEDIISPARIFKTALKAGLNKKQIDKIYQDTEKFLKEKEGL